MLVPKFGIGSPDEGGGAVDELEMVIDEELLAPPLVAVIVAEPEEMPVTKPPALTVATVLLLLVHAVVRPERIFPRTSLSVTLSCCVEPAAIVADDGLTVAELTVGVDGDPVTVTAA
jgi:hypothetical protein